ncbi:MAG: hypothetical protein KJO54_09650 [Gammaproteobacteria bacterium]|nr:hypothetical protein [Gammaproteobacteria bacterium]NNF62539.1 hypothetical protein [Gammaproteobacteria bacterium]NNM20099.1 hypothetical protein [Gammaproteobacteria bacterium]
MKGNLLLLDAAINLVLGVALLWFPAGLVERLGLPAAMPAFYPGILGAVLIGIGIALLVEHYRAGRGLGLQGAISINLCGGLALAAWLVSGNLALPTHGFVLLWGVVAVLIGISLVEFLAGRR